MEGILARLSRFRGFILKKLFALFFIRDKFSTQKITKKQKGHTMKTRSNAVRSLLPKESTGFIPSQTMISGACRTYTAVTLPGGYADARQLLTNLNELGWLIGPDKDVSRMAGRLLRLDMTDKDGRPLQSWHVTANGFKYLRRVYKFRLAGQHTCVAR